MDIESKLNIKYPDLFLPLLSSLRVTNLKPHERQKKIQLIESLLRIDGEIVYLAYQGLSIEAISNRLNIYKNDIHATLAQYNSPDIVKTPLLGVDFCDEFLSKRSSEQEVNDISDEEITEILELTHQLNYQYNNLFKPLENLLNRQELKNRVIYRRYKRRIMDLFYKKEHIEIIRRRKNRETLKSIASKFNVSGERIRQILNKYKGYF